MLHARLLDQRLSLNLRDAHRSSSLDLSRTDDRRRTPAPVVKPDPEEAGHDRPTQQGTQDPPQAIGASSSGSGSGSGFGGFAGAAALRS